MPEEINRVVADHLSTWLFTPSQVSVRQLAAEGITQGVYDVGDIMADSVRLFAPLARERSNVLGRLGLKRGEYFVATVHRAANTDDPKRLAGILDGLNRVQHPVVLPLHPRTKAALKRNGLEAELNAGNIKIIEPLGYLDMLELQQNAAAILTDSGGIQKEAYYLGVPCVTLRDETEWVETVESGWNRLVGVEASKIIAAAQECSCVRSQPHPVLYGNGFAAEKISSVFDR